MGFSSDEARRKYYREYYARNRERVLANTKASYLRHANARRAHATKQWHSLSPEERHRRIRQNKLITKFGIRPEWYDQTVAAQNNCCAICKTSFAERQHSNRSYEDIDHDHRTGQVRGILCRACNMAIHKMDRDIAWAERAVAYLKAHERK